MSYTTENTILRVLTGNKTAEAAQITELIGITTKYPAFGAAKYLLVKKMMQQRQPGFEKYAQDAVLYFPDPFWFHFKLHEEGLMEDVVFLQKKDGPEKSAAASTDPMPAASPGNGLIEPAVKEVAAEVAGPAKTVVQAEATKEEILNFVAAEQPAKQEVNDAVETLGPGQESQHLAPEVEAALPLAKQDPAAAPETVRGEPIEIAAKAEDTIEGDVISTAAELPTEHEAITTAETVQQEDETKDLDAEAETVLPKEQTVQAAVPVTAQGEPIQDAHPGKPEEPAPYEEEATAPQQEIAVNDEPYSKPQIKFIFDESDVDRESDAGEDGEEAIMPALQNQRISSVLQDQLADFKKPVTENAPLPVETEPYHTIDYFASQGIKLTLEQQAQDHLSVKVKKFTDWLKQMKRIAPVPTDLETDEAAERRVKTIAADSNEPKEVLTEAMAEVLVKQGMREKAIEVYDKLSFLYPYKSAYFAAQIEQLKVI